MLKTKTAKELGLSAPYSRHAMAYVLAGGRGSRLLELTDRRAKPAVYFGGKSRIIDFALSNALNSGIRRIAVATQYKAHSLIRHLQRGWNFFRPERNESFDVLPASQRVSETMWYLGTADAVFQNIDIIESYRPQFMVLLAGDHIYKMDYEKMLQQHVDTDADVTVGCLEASLEEARGFGVMHVDAKNTIIKFLEKPKNPPPMPGKPDVALCSMGIYVFETSFLIDLLKRDAADTNSSHDFGKDIIPYIVKNGKAVAHHFSQSCVTSSEEAKPYWRDVGTVDAYWGANIDLTDVVPDLDLYDRSWPIWTYGEITPPAKFVHDVDGPPRLRGFDAALGRLHRLGRVAAAGRSSSPACTSTRSPPSTRLSSCLTSASGATYGSSRRSSTAKCAFPTASSSARIPNSTPNGSAAPKAASPSSHSR